MTVDVNGFISCMRTVIFENGSVCTLGNFLENAGKKISTFASCFLRSIIFCWREIKSVDSLWPNMTWNGFCRSELNSISLLDMQRN